MFKKIAFFLLIALHAFTANIEPFVLVTIPKSGSHLLIKTLHYMTALTPQWHTDPLDIGTLFESSHFPYTHCCLSESLFNYYRRCAVKPIIGIRDLRDVCVSIVYQIQKGAWPEFTYNPAKKQQFQRLSFDEQLLFVIEQEYEIKPPEINLQLGVARVAEQAVSLVQNPDALICRYEDLVGSSGGGSDKRQKELLQQIGLHIGLTLQPEQIERLSSLLYGNQNNPFGTGDFSNYQSTFRDGKIGSWKMAFKEIHKQAFKKRLGSALIALGYEQDDRW